MSQSVLATEIVILLSNMLHLVSKCLQILHHGFWLVTLKSFLGMGNCCRLSSCLLANMMGLDNILIRELSVQLSSHQDFR